MVEKERREKGSGEEIKGTCTCTHGGYIHVLCHELLSNVLEMDKQANQMGLVL